MLSSSPFPAFTFKDSQITDTTYFINGLSFAWFVYTVNFPGLLNVIYPVDRLRLAFKLYSDMFSGMLKYFEEVRLLYTLEFIDGFLKQSIINLRLKNL